MPWEEEEEEAEAEEEVLPFKSPFERRFFNSVKSAEVSKSTKTLLLLLVSNDLRSMLTKTENRLKLPVFWVMSSMYLEANSPVHRAPDSSCSMSTSNVLPELWPVAATRMDRTYWMEWNWT